MADQTQPQNGNKLTIKKYGRGMNSRQFERRWLYLNIQPFDNDLESGINKVVDVLNSLLEVWTPPANPLNFFRPDMWWEHNACTYCKRRAEYELKKWLAGEHVWRRGVCMRHWFVHHLTMIVPHEPFDLISNQPISITAGSIVLFNIETVNYKYNIRLTKQLAEMTVDYKGTLYKFTYRNHMNSYPYISSYMNILFDVHVVMDVFREFLTDYVLKRRLYSNVVINDAITLPPAPPNYAVNQSSPSPSP